MAEPNGKTQATGETSADVDAALLARVAEVRNHLRQAFGQVVMAMLTLPRYRHQSVMDLNALVIEPLLRDRIAMAYAPVQEGQARDLAGMAIWASVSEEVDAHIREQIQAGVFPIRLKPEDWTSGEITWLLDVLASDRKMTGAVLANFKQVVGGGQLRLHPIITRLIDKDMLDRMTKMSTEASDFTGDPDA